MIAALAGTVAAIGVDHAVIDVNGVGYLVHGSARTLGRLAPDTAVRLYIETQVREESITLFGFADVAERDWFRLLTGVQGVGGRLALAILSTLAPADLARALATEDRAMIARTPGVGPKLAARLVTELKGTAPAPAAGSAPSAAPLPAAASRDALSALANLGFRGAEAAAAVAAAEQALGEGADTAALIREALKRAAR
ncbi:MAG: Holliday junction branch migration protein RuvA [Sphingomonadaceae bacterium]